MRDILREAELEKLARILNTDAAGLAFLADSDTATLRTIRVGITRALFAKFRPYFSGFARVSSLLPPAINARIAQRVLGPMLSARIAGEMPPARAIALAGKLPDTFLADICLQMEPERAQGILAGFPVARSVAITQRLLARGETLTMGRFVDVLPHRTLLAAADAIANPADLLQIGCFVENSAQLDRVLAHLSYAARDSLIQAAVERNLWPEIITTLQRMGRESRVILAEQALSHSAATLDSLIRAAAAQDLWPALLAIAEELTPAARAHLAAQPAFDEAAIICSVIDSVRANALWPAFDIQIQNMGEARAARLLRVAAAQRPVFVQEMAQRDLTTAVIANLRSAAATLDADTRRHVIAACADSPLAASLGG